MAGGKGTRLLSITEDKIPKPMTRVNGKPVLQWQIECLRREGITEVLIVTGHLGDKITEFFGNGYRFGVSISYYHESRPLGTAGALGNLSEVLEENFFLIFGDVIFDIDLSRMKAFHQKKASCATLFVHPNNHPFDSDLVLINEHKQVTGILAKSTKRTDYYDNCVNAGFYILNKSVCTMVPKGKKADLEKDILLTLAVKEGNVFAYKSPEYIKDIGTPERINMAEAELNSGIVASRNLNKLQKCVFLDRDGTLNKYCGLISKPEELELENTAIEAVQKLNSSGWLVIVVTNQPVIARGMCSIKDLRYIHKKLQTLLGDKGAFLDDIVFCPHHPDKGYHEENPVYKISCHCRKPDTGMLEQCVEQYNIDLSKSWIVGDTTIDIQTGINAGTHTALVLTGLKGMDQKYDVQPEYVGENLLDIVDYILKEDL